VTVKNLKNSLDISFSFFDDHARAIFLIFDCHVRVRLLAMR